MPQGPAKAEGIRPVLMIFTSHRLDCLALCLRCLSRFTDLSRLEHVYVICNAVTAPHLLVAKSFCDEHDNADLVLCEPRGLVPAVMQSVNEIIARHPGAAFMKIDEDLFVTPGWLDAMLEAHAAHAHDPNTLFTIGLCPVSTTGYRVFDPVMAECFPKLHRRYASLDKHLNENKFFHRSIWEAVLQGGFDQAFCDSEPRPYLYPEQVVINCILYDQRMLEHIYPFHTGPDPETGFQCVDELAFNRALKLKPEYRAVMPTRPILHHYSHWRSEDYLRRHVPLHRVWAYFERMYASHAPLAAEQTENAA